MPMYTVLEVQENGESVGVLTYSFPTETEANAKYYEILFYASQSQMDYHSAVLMCEGFVLKYDRVVHKQSEPEPEVESDEVE